jgi:hypothetical protein
VGQKSTTPNWIVSLLFSSAPHNCFIEGDWVQGTMQRIGDTPAKGPS